MFSRINANGILVVTNGAETKLYGPDREGRMDKHYLGSFVNRGLLKTSAHLNPLYGYDTISSITCSDSVFDIFGPKFEMRVKGCITATLWEHVERELYPKVTV